jgi:hypothetical protein
VNEARYRYTQCPNAQADELSKRRLVEADIIKAEASVSAGEGVDQRHRATEKLLTV